MTQRAGKYASPEYSRSAVDRAGDIVRGQLGFSPDVKLHDALEVIDNWRASHAYPMLAMRITLARRALSIDSEAVIAQRLKRFPTIVDKLEREPEMKLSRMHDIGGCRAILSSSHAVFALVEMYRALNEKAPNRGAKLVRPYDYITNPKPTGYRSYHLVYKYFGSGSSSSRFNGLLIELQLRSHRQHAWATAVETMGIFLRQALKSNLGGAEWLRFFALMGTAIAKSEETPIVPGTPNSPQQLKAELRELSGRLHVASQLGQVSSIISNAQRSEDHYFLLEMHREDRTTRVTSFGRAEVHAATQAYKVAEDAAQSRPVDVVLVAVDRFDALKKAYPNFFFDTALFRAEVEKAIE